VLLPGGSRTFTVSGVIGFGQADNLAGATLAAFDTATAQQVLNRKGFYDEIDVVGQPGVGAATLRDRLAAAVPARYEVLTGADLARQSADEVTKGLGFFTTALLAFAGVALFVGAFLIFNTFAIIVAQRTRELALLRCLGASRRQVLTSVLLESGIVGVLASVAGLGFGLVIAVGLRALLKGFGIELPGTSTQFELRTVVVSLAVGILVTLMSALLPALKATRVAPVAALAPETAFAPTGFRRRRVVLGVLVTAVGVALLLAGLLRDTGNRLANVGAGAAIIFLGVAVLSPLIARPLARVIGWPFARLFRLPGRLARENAMRNPRRTAATAAALMIGLALVAFVSILAASIKASATQVLDKSVAADYILTTQNFQPITTEVARRIASQPQVATVTGVRTGSFKLGGQVKSLSGIDAQAYDQLVRTETTAGNLADLAAGGVAVKDTVAKDHGWQVGDTIAMELPRDGVQQERIQAIYKDNNLNGDYLLALPDYERGYTDQQDQIVLVKAKPGVEPATAKAAIDRAVRDFPNVKVQDQAAYKASTAKQIDQLLGLVSALLGLAILIALFGIVNTLALSIFERVRELGLLRAGGRGHPPPAALDDPLGGGDHRRARGGPRAGHRRLLRLDHGQRPTQPGVHPVRRAGRAARRLRRGRRGRRHPGRGPAGPPRRPGRHAARHRRRVAAEPGEGSGPAPLVAPAAVGDCWHVDRRAAPAVRARRPGRGRPRPGPDRAVRALVRRGDGGRAVRAQRHDAGHRRRGRPPLRAGRAA
jgi:putative ABC transport system permease protein